MQLKAKSKFATRITGVFVVILLTSLLSGCVGSKSNDINIKKNETPVREEDETSTELKEVKDEKNKYGKNTDIVGVWEGDDYWEGSNTLTFYDDGTAKIGYHDYTYELNKDDNTLSMTLYGRTFIFPYELNSDRSLVLYGAMNYYTYDPDAPGVLFYKTGSAKKPKANKNSKLVGEWESNSYWNGENYIQIKEDGTAIVGDYTYKWTDDSEEHVFTLTFDDRSFTHPYELTDNNTLILYEATNYRYYDPTDSGTIFRRIN